MTLVDRARTVCEFAPTFVHVSNKVSLIAIPIGPFYNCEPYSLALLPRPNIDSPVVVLNCAMKEFAFSKESGTQVGGSLEGSDAVWLVEGINLALISGPPVVGNDSSFNLSVLIGILEEDFTGQQVLHELLLVTNGDSIDPIGYLTY